MALGSIGLSTYRWNNNLKSALILALYPAIIAAVCWVAVYFSTWLTIPVPYGIPLTEQAIRRLPYATAIIIQIWPFILSFVAIWFIVASIFHTQMMRSLARSHPVARKEEPELYNLLENLCISQGVAMPAFDIIETHARNAFASGISEKSYRITITRGLLTSLQKDELEAVLAHELTHILKQDVRLLVVTVIFAGLFGFLCQLAWTFFRGSLRMPRGRDNKGGQTLIILVTLGLAIILSAGYFATLWSRFALSRRREYDADAGAIEMTKNPEAMMRALLRINGREQIPNGRADIMMMCIENNVPFMGLFSTHPPISQRVHAISRITGTPVPNLAFPQPALAGLERQGPSPPVNTSKRHNPWAS